MAVELAVLVPVLNRPQNVVPLVESFLSGCPDNSVLLFLVNKYDGEELRAIDTATDKLTSPDYARVDVYPTTYETWPQKINLGAAIAQADWYLCAADDITFIPGWWDATADLRADPQIGVIGTNDSHNGTGNAAVAEGTHTCHPLIRGTYIRDYGTWQIDPGDGPGKAVSDAYHHWYVDNELVITAKLRNAWAFCADAVLEHRHPYWGFDVPFDETYQLGQSHAEEDKQTWFRRATEYGPLQP